MTLKDLSLRDALIKLSGKNLLKFYSFGREYAGKTYTVCNGCGASELSEKDMRNIEHKSECLVKEVNDMLK